MKGLRKVLTPFAPDQSGAVSVLFEMGGILVICDAGGCAGNICGFDEPRWFSHKSAVFSAGLRDMDAILGRDDRLVAKLADTAAKLNADFAAIIGTPVPSVIGTDYNALHRMAERKTNLPVLAIDTTGMALYDSGAEKTWLALFRRFAVPAVPQKGKIGVLGLTPLDFGCDKVAECITASLAADGVNKVVCYGMGNGLEAVKNAAGCEKNIVAAPSALAAAEYLKSNFGTPYEIFDPLAAPLLPTMDYSGKKILVVHQQVRTHTMRQALLRRGAASVTAATWFMKKPLLAQQTDVLLKEEDDFTALVRNGNFDLIFADNILRELAPDFGGVWVDLPHFAVSGRSDSL